MIKTDYEVIFADMNEVDSWMEMVDDIKSNFPGLNIDEYKKVLVKNVNRKTAICAKYKDRVIGGLFYSKYHGCLSWLAIDKAYRRKGISSTMTNMMIKDFDESSTITVTTFRDGDEKGVAPRNLYKSLGFIEGELIVEHDYPLQKFVLSKE